MVKWCGEWVVLMFAIPGPSGNSIIEVQLVGVVVHIVDGKRAQAGGNG